LQQTGVGVVIGLTVLALLVLGLWWWQGDRVERVTQSQGEPGTLMQALPQTATAGES